MYCYSILNSHWQHVKEEVLVLISDVSWPLSQPTCTRGGQKLKFPTTSKCKLTSYYNSQNFDLKWLQIGHFEFLNFLKIGWIHLPYCKEGSNLIQIIQIIGTTALSVSFFLTKFMQILPRDSIADIYTWTVSF